MKLLTANDLYIARRIAIPLITTLVIAAMLLMLDQMLRLFDFVATEGGPVTVVFRLLANLMPEYFAIASKSETTSGTNPSIFRKRAQ